MHSNNNGKTNDVKPKYQRKTRRPVIKQINIPTSLLNIDGFTKMVNILDEQNEKKQPIKNLERLLKEVKRHDSHQYALTEEEAKRQKKSDCCQKYCNCNFI